MTNYEIGKLLLSMAKHLTHGLSLSSVGMITQLSTTSPAAVVTTLKRLKFSRLMTLMKWTT